MASNDKTAILTDDETDQRWNGSLAETVNSWPTEEVPNLSSSVPTPESLPTDAATSTSQSREPTTGCLQSVFSRINRDLLISKIFYFFFYAAYGSLHPLLPVYYKQLGLMASESGLLVGIRYFIEFCSAPFWGVVADRFRKGKAVLLFSVLCWLMFNCSISFVKPADMSCVQQNSTVAPQNSTQLNRSSIHSRNRRYLEGDLFASSRLSHGMDSVYKVQHRYERSASNFTALTTMYVTSSNTTTTSPNTISVTSSNTTTTAPNTISVTSSNTTTTAPNTTSTTASQKNYQIVYNKEQVQTIFVTILLVVIFGEFFSAPAVTIVDTVTLQYLGQNRDRYGLQRMWGSLGWGLAMLAVGIWIDNTYFQPFVQGTGCDQTEQQNYQIAFIVFGVLMGVALLVATQFYFDSHNDQRASQVLNITETQVPGRPPAELSDGDPPSEDTFPPEGSRQEFHFSELLRVLCSVRNSTVLFVAWFMGFGYGFVFSFLYWYLQSLNGTTTLFGICSVLNHISELIAYFTSHKLIELVGHIRVLYIGLACNTARYLYISYLENAWIVLPMEVLQGMTHASVWAACISYLSATVPPSLRTSAQGILQGLHLGLGRGCGAMLGGVFITYFGEAATFRGLGMASLVTLLIFYLIQFLARQSERQDKMQAENIPVPPSPISIATIDLDRHHSELQRPQPERRQQPMKTKHQEEQEDANNPAWAFSGPPWVAVAFALCQMQEGMKTARRNTLADAQALQGTNESSSPMGPAETSHTHAAEQPSTLEDPSSPTRRPSKKCVEFTGTHGHQEQPSILPPTDQTKSVENPTPLPGNFEKPPHLSSNNPFYQ